MKILVLGGSGMAGHTISIYLKEKGYDVTAFTRKEINFCKYIKGDITDFNQLSESLKKNSFNVIINSIGVLNENANKNKSNAVLVNSYLPHFLSDFTKNINTKIIHLSTDCVFSGDKGSYNEDSFRDGLTFYDRTKALGEIENNKDLTFRNSIIGPDINDEGIGLFNWFMKQQNDIIGYSQVFWNGVTTITLAKAIEKAILENLTGIYHLVNKDGINKYELLNLFNKHIKLNKIKINFCDKIKINKSLNNNRKDFSFVVPDYETMIYEMKEWIYNHKDLYYYYFKESN